MVARGRFEFGVFSPVGGSPFAFNAIQSPLCLDGPPKVVLCPLHHRAEKDSSRRVLLNVDRFSHIFRNPHVRRQTRENIGILATGRVTSGVGRKVLSLQFTTA